MVDAVTHGRTYIRLEARPHYDSFQGAQRLEVV